MTDEKPRSVLSPLFWAAMVFCLLCFAGAAYVAMTAVRGHERPPLASTATRAKGRP
jgi:hypothetical protein